MVKTLKFLLIFMLAVPVIFFVNTGFSTGIYWQVYQTFGFSVVFSLSLVWPKVRRYFLILSVFLFIYMAVSFILSQNEWAQISGSSGFGLVLLLLISYLPQIIKKGYITNL